MPTVVNPGFRKSLSTQVVATQEEGILGVRLRGSERGYAEVNAEQDTSGEELLWLFTSTRKP